MKNKYLKSIGLILFGGILSSIIYSYKPLEPKAEKTIDSLRGRYVSLDTMRQNVAAYRAWQRFIPDLVQIDTIDEPVKIHYVSKEIHKEDWKIIKTYVNAFIAKNSKYKYSHFPFIHELDQSYYISRADIDSALKDQGNWKPSGINVYLAMKGLTDLKFDKLKSHLYVVPTDITGNTTLKDHLVDGEHGLDLTHPCPSLCDLTGPINDKLELDPYRKE